MQSNAGSILIGNFYIYILYVIFLCLKILYVCDIKVLIDIDRPIFILYAAYSLSVSLLSVWAYYVVSGFCCLVRTTCVGDVIHA